MNAIERYAAPVSIEEAVRILEGEEATLFAGATDVLPRARTGALAFKPILVNLRRISELKGIREEAGALRIGATTTVTEILESDLLRGRAEILCRIADCFAGGQVRNSATLGGNVANASPAGDLIIPLILLDAEVELASWNGGGVSFRRLPVSDFFTGPGQTRREPKELITAFYFPAPHERFTAAFKKFGTRPAMDIAVVSVGIGGRWEGGTLREARAAFGAVAPVPLRGRKTEAVIEGQRLNDAVVTRAAEAAEKEITPIDDVRASAGYRRELVRVFTERLLRHVRQSGD